MSQALAVVDKAQVQTTKAPDPVATLSTYLRTREGKIAEIMPKAMAKTMSPTRLITIAMAAASRNPTLLQCSPESVYLSLHHAAQLGLEAGGPLGHFYLVPRWNGKLGRNECTSVIGYKGLAELCRRSGEISRIDAAVVYDGEEFVVKRGLNPDLEHIWDIAVSRVQSKVIAAYAVLVTKDGAKYFEVLTRSEIETRRAKSTSKTGPWYSDYGAMCRKSALRALLAGGLVPLSTELAIALDQDIRAEEPDEVSTPVQELPAEEEGTQADRVKIEIRRKRTAKAQPVEQPEPRREAEAAQASGVQQQSADTEVFGYEEEDEKPAQAPPGQATREAHADAMALIRQGATERWMTEQQVTDYQRHLDEWLAMDARDSIETAIVRLERRRVQTMRNPREPGTEGG